MKINRVIAAAMSAVMLLGFSGCDKTGGGSKDGIEKVMESYTDALTDFDGDSLFELTNWEEDSKDYEELEKYFNTAKYATEGDSLFLECVTYIASTIDVDYDIDELEANGKEATLKVTYKLVDWNTVYNDGIHVFQSYGDVLESLKSAKDTVSIKGKISFELDGKEWKISKIAKIKDVLEFAKVDPYINPVLPDPTETQPSETSGTTETGGTTETSETGSTIDVAEVYPKAISAYIDVLEKFEPFIRNCQTIYGEDYCSLCDLDSNGIPEMYFIAADNIEDAYSSASLYIYSYDEKTGKAVEAVKVPEILRRMPIPMSSCIIHLTDVTSHTNMIP